MMFGWLLVDVVMNWVTELILIIITDNDIDDNGSWTCLTRSWCYRSEAGEEKKVWMDSGAEIRNENNMKKM